MIADAAGRPLPHEDALTAPFWQAANQRRFTLPFCTACGLAHFYPRSVCPHCGSATIAWRDASGRGTIYSYTKVLRAPSPAFAALVPYVVALIALEEGPHLMSGLLGCAPDAVRIGMPVTVDFLELGETKLPMFRPADAEMGEAAA